MIMIMEFDVVVAGGGVGGAIAALTAAKEGLKVLLTEEYDWIGGQFTTQAVPPDEHKWIEQFGCTRSYRDFRSRIRAFYKQYFTLSNEARKCSELNPGNAWVTNIAFEPRVALHILNEMLLPYIHESRLSIMLETKAVKAIIEGNYVKAVVFKNLKTGLELQANSKYFIDATEIGELLPLTGTEYVTGAEGRNETGEPHAPEQSNPYDIQPVTWVAAVDFVPGRKHIIDKPKRYDFFHTYIPEHSSHSLLSLFVPDHFEGGERQLGIFKGNEKYPLPLWPYRRIIDPKNFKDCIRLHEVSLINWPQNDYIFGNIYEDPHVAANMEDARQLTLSLIYWLQTECPREDGKGIGYPEIRMRGDITGTVDGLAKAPYIRESRRIKAQYTILESDLTMATRNGIKSYEDSVGVGSYYLDLHPTTATKYFTFLPSWPYELPLGTLIPERIKNLIPGSKNIGTTHLSNGCLREHPIEWNIGEVAGYLVSRAISIGEEPSKIRNTPELLLEFQKLVIEKGIEIHWPDNMIY